VGLELEELPNPFEQMGAISGSHAQPRVNAAPVPPQRLSVLVGLIPHLGDIEGLLIGLIGGLLSTEEAAHG
jgi:hypothetical protein